MWEIWLDYFGEDPRSVLVEKNYRSHEFPPSLYPYLDQLRPLKPVRKAPLNQHQRYDYFQSLVMMGDRHGYWLAEPSTRMDPIVRARRVWVEEKRNEAP